jgi:transcriptional regulator with PAS, ATPase and Fis domain
MCEGAIIVDRDARIVWISDKYAARLDLESPRDGGRPGRRGRDPNSLMREVVRTGEPIMLDIMQFGDASFVVMRVPIKDERGRVIGAAGFMLFDRLQYLQPLVSKFQRLETQLADIQKSLAEERRVKYTFSNFIGSSPAAMESEAPGAPRRAGRHHRAPARRDRHRQGSARAGDPLREPARPRPLHRQSTSRRSPSDARAGVLRPAHGRAREGKFMLADGGTLFLDEVGDMPMAMQAKLLRVLQEKEVEPLGSNRVTKVDVRVIAASSVDLRQMVSMGRFRSDLYYRLSVLPIELPPLRDRIGDLELLCDHILEEIATARAARSARSRRPRSRCSPATRGRATSASCATSSSR